MNIRVLSLPGLAVIRNYLLMIVVFTGMSVFFNKNRMINAVFQNEIFVNFSLDELRRSYEIRFLSTKQLFRNSGQTECESGYGPCNLGTVEVRRGCC